MSNTLLYVTLDTLDLYYFKVEGPSPRWGPILVDKLRGPSKGGAPLPLLLDKLRGPHVGRWGLHITFTHRKNEDLHRKKILTRGPHVAGAPVLHLRIEEMKTCIKEISHMSHRWGPCTFLRLEKYFVEKMKICKERKFVWVWGRFRKLEFEATRRPIKSYTLRWSEKNRWSSILLIF